MEMPSKHSLRSAFYVVVIVSCLSGLGVYLHYSIGESGGAERFPLSWFMMVAAIAGSIVNQPFHKSEMSQVSAVSIAAYVTWKCSVSIVFAFVLYMLFISGIVSGDLFPKFLKSTVETGGSYQSMEKFVTAVKPESYKDVAKVLVWCFIAGYSERFVPNLIAQLSKHKISS